MTISNIAFYGLGAAIIILSYFATTQLESRLSSMETAIEQQAKQLKVLQHD
jgi:hypothetical protein